VARQVLIVEDDPDTREAFMLLLEQWGLEAHQCANGPDAILAAAQFLPDIAVIDISLLGWTE
jgi:CheY-like chemotaxis protein